MMDNAEFNESILEKVLQEETTALETITPLIIDQQNDELEL